MIYLKLLLTAVFWGGTFIAGRHITTDVEPYSAGFLRFCVAVVLLVLLTLRAERGLPAISLRQLAAIVVLGLSGIFAYNAFFFSGLKEVEAGRAAVIIANNPISITLFSVLLFREKISPARILGILVSVSGAIVVITRGDVLGIFSEGFGRGEFYIFCCVLSWTIYSLVGKTVMRRLSPLVTVTYSSIAGTIMLFPMALREGLFSEATHYSRIDWAGLGYLGVFGTVVGFTWFYEGMHVIGPVRASQFINFVPICAVLLAFLILKEPLTISLVAGTALVITGVYLTNAKRKDGGAAREKEPA
jgi:drug/metabolite transporter (DMT)-like permease